MTRSHMGTCTFPVPTSSCPLETRLDSLPGGALSLGWVQRALMPTGPAARLQLDGEKARASQRVSNGLLV